MRQHIKDEGALPIILSRGNAITKTHHPQGEANCYRRRGGKLVIMGGLNVIQKYLAAENTANSKTRSNYVDNQIAYSSVSGWQRHLKQFDSAAKENSKR